MSENEQAERSSARDNRMFWGTFAAVIVLLVGGVAYAVVQHQAEEREEREKVHEMACAISMEEGRLPPSCVEFACETLPLAEDSLQRLCYELAGEDAG